MLLGQKKENEKLKSEIIKAEKQVEDLKKERQRMMEEFDRNTEVLKHLRHQIEEVLEKNRLL